MMRTIRPIAKLLPVPLLAAVGALALWLMLLAPGL